MNVALPTGHHTSLWVATFSPIFQTDPLRKTGGGCLSRICLSIVRLYETSERMMSRHTKRNSASLFRGLPVQLTFVSDSGAGSSTRYDQIEDAAAPVSRETVSISAFATRCMASAAFLLMPFLAVANAAEKAPLPGIVEMSCGEWLATITCKHSAERAKDNEGPLFCNDNTFSLTKFGKHYSLPDVGRLMRGQWDGLYSISTPVSLACTATDDGNYLIVGVSFRVKSCGGQCENIFAIDDGGKVSVNPFDKKLVRSMDNMKLLDVRNDKE
jgi:hypothetical protein